MSGMASGPPIEHDAVAGRFRIRLPAGVAELAYAPVEEGVLDLYSTYVPPRERGRGVAARLVSAALAHARERGMRVMPSCWYVRRWIDAHPEQEDLLA
ncbi:MAG TPA: GNAT family N-acetyltransferase [Gemmatimonadales bacterium]|nr:GNAT family N-acetyltransferase [Gemmatimonadales bacterium]